MKLFIGSLIIMALCLRLNRLARWLHSTLEPRIGPKGLMEDSAKH